MLLGLTPWFIPFVVLLVLVGFISVTFNTLGNSSVQLASSPELRGRVMSLYMLVFMGGTPLGSLLVGWITEAWGAPTALVISGGVCIVGGRGRGGAGRQVGRDLDPPESAPRPAREWRSGPRTGHRQSAVGRPEPAPDPCGAVELGAVSPIRSSGPGLARQPMVTRTCPSTLCPPSRTTGRPAPEPGGCPGALRPWTACRATRCRSRSTGCRARRTPRSCRAVESAMTSSPCSPAVDRAGRAPRHRGWRRRAAGVRLDGRGGPC